MSANAIVFHPETNEFQFDSTFLTRREVETRVEAARPKNGRRSHGVAPRLTIGTVTLTPGYLSRMLRHTDRHGQFVDILDHTRDHRFNNTMPTPGGDWGSRKAARSRRRAGAV